MFYTSCSLKIYQIRWNSIVLLGKVKRWLCLERYCPKETKKFEALTSMFSSRTDSSSKQDVGKEDDDIKNRGSNASKKITNTL